MSSPTSPGIVDAMFAHAKAGRWDDLLASLPTDFDVDTRNRHTGYTLLLAACGLFRQAHPHTVTALLGRGANPNIKDFAGNAPLHTAATHGTAAICSALLQRGADVNGVDMAGRTPLWLVTSAGGGDGDERAAVLLSRPDLDLSATFNGKTTAQWARERGAHNILGMIEEEVRGLLWLPNFPSTFLDSRSTTVS